MVLYRLPLMILTLSLVYIFIAPDEPFTFKLFFKLLPMIVIILYAFRIAPENKRCVHWFIMLGLVFSMIGDATLHWFLIGLVAFFIAHICYAIGFLKVAKFTKRRILAAIPIGIYAIIFGIFLIPALTDAREQVLAVPVVAYIIIISLMLLATILTGNRPAQFGALLFVISDSILAWNMFVAAVPFAEALVMLPYYAAQFFIAVSLYSLIEQDKRIVW